MAQVASNSSSPLFGQDQAAGMAVKQRCIEAFFKPAHLTGHRRLGQMQGVACVGQTAGICYCMKDSKLVPIHFGNFLCIPREPAHLCSSELALLINLALNLNSAIQVSFVT